MYTEGLFNFSKIVDDKGLEESAEMLSLMAVKKPVFALDTGISADDIWNRAATFRRCVSLIEDEDTQRTLMNMIHFTAGVMPDSDTVENRFSVVESLEENIAEFKNSDDEFANRLIAIGPCGIDHDWDSVEYEGRDHEYFDNRTIGDERDLFALQLTLGKKLNMPVILHSRKGFKDTVDVLKAVKWNKGVVHGFAYTQSELDFFLDAGWYISFNGAVTYAGKKSFIDMAEIVASVPKDRLIIETDSPYYAPVPLKSNRNVPVNIHYIYEYVAAKRGTTIHKICDSVDENCRRLFGF